MVLVLPKVSGFGEQMGGALGNLGGQLAGSYAGNKLKGNPLAAQDETIKKKYGIDLSGITDPDERKIVFQSEMKGRQKQNELQQKYEQIGKVLGGQTQEQGMGNRLASGGQQRSPPFLNDEQIGANESSGYSNEQIAQITAIDPNIGRLLQQQKKETEKERRFSEGKLSAKEMKYFEMNEPKLEKIADTERKLDIESARYGRLEELFSDPSKFPSGLTAALFTKEGQLSDLAYSQLSPEAQEAVKLIIDSTSNIKDTYGARVTNFDLQTYLRKLPSLLNSPEGRSRVIRDLKSLNEINQIYNRGIQEIFDESGGTDKIPFSEAEKRFKKKYGAELQKKLSDFANPDQKIFESKPEASKYLGKKIKDSKTGEVFISDGVEWKPFGG